MDYLTGEKFIMAQNAYQPPLFFPQHDAVSSDEYLVGLSISAEVASDIRAFTNKVWELVGDFPTHYSEPFIPICNFLGSHDSLEELRSGLEKIAEKLPSSSIHFKNFKSFEVSGTIYLTPHPRHYFSALLRSLYPAIVNCKGVNRQSNIYSNTEPYVIIARGLSRGQFATTWEYFKTLCYRGVFVARRLVLLRKEFLKNDDYRPVASASLQPTPVLVS